MRRIIMGSIVLVMAFTLSRMWMTLVQSAAGALLIAIGIIETVKDKKYRKP